MGRRFWDLSIDKSDKLIKETAEWAENLAERDSLCRRYGMLLAEYQLGGRSSGIGVLLGIVIYQQIVFRTGMQRKLVKMSEKRKEILDYDTNESTMVFTRTHLTDAIFNLSFVIKKKRGKCIVKVVSFYGMD